MFKSSYISATNGIYTNLSSSNLTANNLSSSNLSATNLSATKLKIQNYAGNFVLLSDKMGIKFATVTGNPPALNGGVVMFNVKLGGAGSWTTNTKNGTADVTLAFYGSSEVNNKVHLTVTNYSQFSTDGTMRIGVVSSSNNTGITADLYVYNSTKTSGFANVSLIGYDGYISPTCKTDTITTIPSNIKQATYM